MTELDAAWWYVDFLDELYGSCGGLSCYVENDYGESTIVKCEECIYYNPPSDYIGEIYYP